MIDIDSNLGRLLLDAAMVVSLIISNVYTWMTARSKANRIAIELMAEELSKVKSRIDVLETDVRHLPDHSDLGAVHDKVNEMASVMREMKGAMNGMGNTLNMIHQSLLDERGKGK